MGPRFDEMRLPDGRTAHQRTITPTGGRPTCSGNRAGRRESELVRFGIELAVIGGGPAGLRAAEVAAAGGASVTVFDSKPSVGRKFLVAGRGGFNLTHDEPRSDFVSRYSGPEAAAPFWNGLLNEFDAAALRRWAAGFGVETFAASTGRVYPSELKSAQLLRRWVHRLRESGVRFAMNHRWTSLEARSPGKRMKVGFETPGELVTVEVDAVVFALGGGSWPETGSDGAWVVPMRALSISVAPLCASNCGWETDWPRAVLDRAEGRPLKNVVGSAGTESVAGELMITRYGLEGGIIYLLGAVLRTMAEPELRVDLKPNHSVEELVRKLGLCRSHFLREARSRWRLDEAAFSLLQTQCEASADFASSEAAARAAKACRIRLKGARPIDEAISSAGGVRWSELDESLMVRGIPGVFVAGEMIDWDAPTGGYLMQGCFATGTRAGSRAVEWMRARVPIG